MSAARKLGAGVVPRRNVGDALLDADTVQVVKVRCACDWTQDEEIALDEPLKRQLAEVSCGRCGGRLGQVAVVR